MKFILNIGLNVPGTQLQNDPRAVLALVTYLFGEPDGNVVHSSDTEPTLVCTISQMGGGQYLVTPAALSMLAGWLHQEAVAMMPEGQPERGELYGEKAQEWGPFNPALFILPNGRRAG